MSKTPFENQLPRQLDPRKFAQQGIDIAGFAEVSELSRLTESLTSTEGCVNVSLQFDIGEQRILQVNGQVEAELYTVCQRCLDALPIIVNCEIHLAILWKEEDAERLPKYLDPWIIGEGQTDIYQIIEDELLLSLPIVSYHEEACIPNTYFSSGEKEASKEIEKAPNTNPFQVLQALKGSLQSEDDK